MAMSDDHKQKIRAAVRASWTPERREAMRQQRLGKNNPFFGKSHTEEHKKRLREKESGERNPFYGRKHDEKVIEALKESRRGITYRLKKYGITPEEYQAKINSGLMWCSYHKDFAPTDAFGPKSKTGRCTACVRKAMLSKFGVTPEWYIAKLKEQNGGCAICGATSTNKRHLSVDHCHKTGMVRGILCLRCNSAIERIDSIPEWIARAVNYLKTNDLTP